MSERYLLMEQEAAELVEKQRSIMEAVQAEKREMTSAERDDFFSFQGAAHSLEVNARALRDDELEKLKTATPSAPAVDTDEAIKADFRNYIKTGTEPKASVTMTDAAGGYIVPEPIQKGLVEKIRLRNPIMGNATIFTMTGDVVMNLPRKVSHGVVAVAADTGARTEQTAPTFGSVALRAYDHYTDQRATQQWLDSVDGAENLMLTWIYEDLIEHAEYLMVSGSGVATESAGFFANTGTSGYTLKYTAGSTGSAANTDIFQLYFALAPKYRGAAKWYMGGPQLAKLSVLGHPGAADTPLVQMNGEGLPVIFGKQVIEVDSAPATASAAYPIALADMANAYAVGIHRDVTILRDPYSAPPYIRYYGILRAGGAPWDRQAAVLLHADSS